MKRWKLFFGIVFILAVVAALMGFGVHGYFAVRGHGAVSVTAEEFHESNKKLTNPGRGFYSMNGFYIHDSMTDFREDIAKRYAMDNDTTLTMVQINLAEFMNRPISERGLQNIDSLFATLQTLDKQLIVRFLYDWDGENEGNEPLSLSTVTNHMEQVAPIVNSYSDSIFCMQGLFIGNWGEMNGTKYAGREDIMTLANKLAEVTDEDIYLSVRMPMHWRMATSCAEAETSVRGGGALADRLGLYNDGMLGSASDYGTYGTKSREEMGDFLYWSRAEEIAFQDVLCRNVPNGGEVIFDNPYNDFENAKADFCAMHISYLNHFFDQNVYDKWARVTVSDGSVFDGESGLSYMEKHLGYRLVLRDNTLTYQRREDALQVDITFQNVGFAPLYREPSVALRIVEPESGICIDIPTATDLRSLCGGTENDKIYELSKTVSLKGMEAGTYDIYLYLEDKAAGMPIMLANEQEADGYGYRLGSMRLEEKPF